VGFGKYPKPVEFIPAANSRKWSWPDQEPAETGKGQKYRAEESAAVIAVTGNQRVNAPNYK